VNRIELIASSKVSTETMDTLSEWLLIIQAYLNKTTGKEPTAETVM